MSLRESSSNRTLPLMEMGLLGLALGLLAQYLWFPPATVLILYWQVTAMMVLTAGMLATTAWQRYKAVNLILLRPALLGSYWVLLEPMRPLLLEAGLAGSIALGTYWILTAGIILVICSSLLAVFGLFHAPDR